MKLALILFSICLQACHFVLAQEMPEKCVQLPQRTTVCPNLLYKKSPIDVPLTETKKGEIVCICMADFSTLRIGAESELEKIDQQVELSRAANRVKLSEQDLLTLIRK